MDGIVILSAKKPFERKDVLLFTVFPLMFGAYSSTVVGLCTGAIATGFFVLFSTITFAHCPFFLYVWIKAQRFKGAESD